MEKGLPTTEKILPRRKAKTVEIGKANWKRFILYGGGALALALLILIGMILFTGRPGALDSIAVLPFESPEADPEMEYLSDGLMESLINKLSQLPDLKVISSFSVLKYKGQKPNLADVASELNVQVVLTGRIAQRGDALSITTELINVKDNTRIWGERYNRKFDEIFAVQDEISKEISDKLQLRVTGEEKKLLTKRYTENIEAYKWYIQGSFHWKRRTHQDLQKAIDFFEKAVAVDPLYALGYASLSKTYVLLGQLGYESVESVRFRAEEYALKALTLDEELAEAHTALAAIKQSWEWDFQGAEEEYKKAIQLNPNYATAHQWLAELYSGTERYQLAHEEIRKAIELDPHAMIMKCIRAQIYLCEKKYDEAIESVERVAEENPDFFLPHLDLVAAYIGKREYDKALEIAEKMREPGYKAFGQVRVYAAKGDIAKAQEKFQEFLKISQEQYFHPAMIALVYGDLGHLDEAFDLYEKAVEERSPSVFTLNLFPPSQAVQQDPRYKELRKRIGLE
jgi:TolB-like protein/Tfp pilus assembly protein PilF